MDGEHRTRGVLLALGGNGLLYVGARGGSDLLAAFDAAGVAGCTTTPRRCPPLWTAAVGNEWSSPAVADGRVFMADPGSVRAFDAAGVQHCTGAPKVCTPLWTTLLDIQSVDQSPTVGDGIVHLGGKGGVFALDAGTGTPVRRFVTPAGTDGNNPSVAGNVLYTAAGNAPAAFDARGVTNCSAHDSVCAPLWTAAGGGGFSQAVANGKVYVVTGNGLRVFDATGNANCSGSPKTCSPLWTAPAARAGFSVPAVTDTVVYVAANDGHLYAFDAAGGTGCSGVPKTCALWFASIGVTAGTATVSPAVANGLVFAGGGSDLAAFDAGGHTGCTGTPRTCAPLWSASGLSLWSSGPTVAGGGVFVGGFDELHAFRLPG